MADEIKVPQAMLKEMEELGAIVEDTRYSSECLGIRLRNIWPQFEKWLLTIPRRPRRKGGVMDDILKTAWGDLLNENEKLAALLDEKDAEIERHIREKVELAGLVAKERARIEWLLDALATIAQSTPQNLDAEMLRVIARAALAGKEGT